MLVSSESIAPTDGPRVGPGAWRFDPAPGAAHPTRRPSPHRRQGSPPVRVRPAPVPARQTDLGFLARAVSSCVLLRAARGRPRSYDIPRAAISGALNSRRARPPTSTKIGAWKTAVATSTTSAGQTNWPASVGFTARSPQGRRRGTIRGCASRAKRRDAGRWCWPGDGAAPRPDRPRGLRR